MKNILPEVFDVISLLRPYDIDLPKVYIGRERDGGYVMADRGFFSDVLSFGVGWDVSFELDLAMRGSRVFMHDHTVEGVPENHDNFKFSKIGICAEGETTEALAPMTSHISKIGDLSPSAVLKMDVEGYEWQVFSTIDASSLSHFDQIVLEVHWLNRLTEPEFRDSVERSLKLINMNFTLFHVHVNNCEDIEVVGGFTVANVLELSYVRSSLVRRRPSQTVYPSSLNKGNHPNFNDIPLLFYPFMPTNIENYVVREAVKRSVM